MTIGDTIADGTMTAKPGEKTFPIVREKVDGIIPVEEKFIHRAVKLLLLEGKVLAEPSSCMTLGAALRAPFLSRKTTMSFSFFQAAMWISPSLKKSAQKSKEPLW